MNTGRTLALAKRIIQQFRRDRRTLALIFLVPVLILTLLGYIIRSQVSGALVFPADFSYSLLSGRQARIKLMLEGSNPSKTQSASILIQGILLKAVMELSAELRMPQAQPRLEVTLDLIYGGTDLEMLDYLAPVLIAFFAFFLIFLLTCVSFLRERTLGTMERLAASPMKRGEIVLGYMLGFGLFALIQSGIIVLFTAYVLRIHYAGHLAWVFIVTLLLSLGAVNLGIFLSTFARNELQAIQFIPIVIVPQGLLCGLLWPVQDMPRFLQIVAHCLPLTYANNAMTDIMIRGMGFLEILPEMAVLIFFASLTVVLASLTLRREVA